MSLLNRIVHYAIAILFTLFAIVQFNDPDFWLWSTAYGIVAVIAFLNGFGKPCPKFSLVIALIYALWCLSYLPAVFDWINMGMPNIAGSMKTDEPHIELVREFGGLLICLPVLIYYAKRR